MALVNFMDALTEEAYGLMQELHLLWRYLGTRICVVAKIDKLEKIAKEARQSNQIPPVFCFFRNSRI